MIERETFVEECYRLLAQAGLRRESGAIISAIMSTMEELGVDLATFPIVAPPILSRVISEYEHVRSAVESRKCH